MMEKLTRSATWLPDSFRTLAAFAMTSQTATQTSSSLTTREPTRAWLGIDAFRAALIITAIVFVTRALWYDFRVLEAPEDRRGMLASWTLAWSIALLPGLLAACLLTLKSRSVGLIPAIAILLSTHALVTGLTFGNSKFYIAVEIFQYMLPAAGFILASQFCNSREAIALLLVIAITVAALDFIKFLYFFSATEFSKMRHGNFYDTIPLIAFAATSYCGYRLHWSVKACLASAWFLATLGQKRTLLIIAFVITSLGAWTSLNRTRTVAVLVVAAIVPALWIASIAASGANPALTYRLTVLLPMQIQSAAETFSEDPATAGQEKSQPAAQHRIATRVDEARQLIRTLNEEPWRYLVGFGGGATFKWQNVDGWHGEQVRHSVHLTPLAMIYRHGLLGLAAYLILIAYGLITIVRAIRSTSNLDILTLAAFCLLYKFAAASASLFSFYLVNDLIYGLLLGTTLLLHRGTAQGKTGSDTDPDPDPKTLATKNAPQ